MDTIIIEHFKKYDPILHSYIEKIEMFEWTAGKNLFADLCDAIISQQLSEKAGATIWKRFVQLFPDGNVTPELLEKIPDQSIRDAGSSWSKVRSLKDLTDKVIHKQIELDKLSELSNDEVIKELIQVKGIGPWTAEMFLMFSLKRPDIFSHGDLGLRNAIQKMYGFKTKPTVEQIEKIIKNWSPYKSYASRILWKSLEIKTENTKA